MSAVVASGVLKKKAARKKYQKPSGLLRPSRYAGWPPRSWAKATRRPSAICCGASREKA